MRLLGSKYGFKMGLCQKCVCGGGFAPDPAGVAYNASPDPLAGFGGCFAAVRKGKGRGEDDRRGLGKIGKMRGGE